MKERERERERELSERERGIGIDKENLRKAQNVHLDVRKSLRIVQIGSAAFGQKHLTDRHMADTAIKRLVDKYVDQITWSQPCRPNISSVNCLSAKWLSTECHRTIETFRALMGCHHCHNIFLIWQNRLVCFTLADIFYPSLIFTGKAD